MGFVAILGMLPIFESIEWTHTVKILQNLCTVMAGLEMQDIPGEIDIDSDPIARYGF